MNIPFILCCAILFSPVCKSESRRLRRLPIIYVPTHAEIPGVKNFKSYKSKVKLKPPFKENYEPENQLPAILKSVDTIISFRDSYLVNIEEIPCIASISFNLKADVDFSKSEPISNDSFNTYNYSIRSGITANCYIDDEIDTTKIISLNGETYYVNISTKNSRAHNYKSSPDLNEITTDIVLQIKDSSHTQLRSFIIPVQYYLKLVRPSNISCRPEELVQSGGYIYYHPILSTPNHRTIYLSIKGDKAIKLEDPNDYE